MGCCSGMFRFFLIILNVLLLIFFGVLATIGLLIRFDKGFLMEALSRALQTWPVQFLNDCVTLIENFGAPISIALIVIGFFVVAISLIGIFALICKVKFLAVIYMAGLTLLSFAELVMIIYTYAIPGNIYLIADKLLNKTLDVYGDGGPYDNASRHLWEMIGSGQPPFCCGLFGYTDFGRNGNSTPLPEACCMRNGSHPPGLLLACDYYTASQFNVTGCQMKIRQYVDMHKMTFLIFACCVFTFQLVVLIIMGALFTHWTKGEPAKSE